MIFFLKKMLMNISYENPLIFTVSPDIGARSSIPNDINLCNNYFQLKVTFVVIFLQNIDFLRRTIL